jgi:hypothetical protein
MKLSGMLLRYRKICYSSFQTERVHGCPFSNQTELYRILFRILNYSVSISSIKPRNLSVQLCNILYIPHTSSTFSNFSSLIRAFPASAAICVNSTRCRVFVCNGTPKFPDLRDLLSVWFNYLREYIKFHYINSWRNICLHLIAVKDKNKTIIYAYVTGLMTTLAEELRLQGRNKIKVSCVCPFIVRTIEAISTLIDSRCVP